MPILSGQFSRVRVMAKMPAAARMIPNPLLISKYFHVSIGVLLDATGSVLVSMSLSVGRKTAGTAAQKLIPPLVAQPTARKSSLLLLQ